MSNSCNATWEDMGFAPEERAHWTALGLLDAVAVRDLTSVYQRYTNDELRRLAEGEQAKELLVVVVRDPDASNDHFVFGGHAEIYDVDLGYADLSDRFEFLEWAGSHLGSAKALEPDHPGAAVLLRDIVMQQAANADDADIRDADSEQLLALAQGVTPDP